MIKAAICPVCGKRANVPASFCEVSCYAFTPFHEAKWFHRHLCLDKHILLRKQLRYRRWCRFWQKFYKWLEEDFDWRHV